MYVSAFDYIDKYLTVVGVTSDGVSIISFMSVVGAPVGIAIASSTLMFSRTTELIKKLLCITKKQKEDA